ncbi:hypothetical protein AAF712_013435 [Marasmius tenuissimus]|uniref:Transposase n=1 Tax=Marasmius tenuissimus TaxID=585030 RepID=A0ABR2ZF00_9AGAR
MFSQISIITASILRITKNEAFNNLEVEKIALEREVQQLKQYNAQLQTQLLNVCTNSISASLPPASSASTSASAAQSTATSKQEKPDSCHVKWWMCPSSTDQHAFRKFKAGKVIDDDNDTGSDKDSDKENDNDSSSKNGVFAWIKQNDGSLISLEEKRLTYRHHHHFWNDLNYPEAPRNFSTIKYDHIDTFVKFIEEKHPWLALCNSNWKAKKLAKQNFKLWRTTFMRRKARDAKEKEKKEKKSRKRGRTEQDKDTDKDHDNGKTASVSAAGGAKKKLKVPLTRVVISDSESDHGDSPAVCLFSTLQTPYLCLITCSS